MFELPTERLMLRDLVEDDWRLVYAMSREPGVTRYQSWLRIPDEARARQWVGDAMHHNRLVPRRAYNVAVVERASEQALGWLGFGLREGFDHGEFSFGYGLLPRVWGRGYMTEAARGGGVYVRAPRRAVCNGGMCRQQPCFGAGAGESRASLELTTRRL